MARSAARRFAVIRVPSSGPPALIAAPNVFESHAAAQARIDTIEAGHRKQHHTYLDIVPFDGTLERMLRSEGILR